MALTFVIVFFIICFLIPSLRVWKKLKVNPFVFGNTDNAHDLIGLYLKIIFAGTFLSGIESSGASLLSFEKIEAIPTMSEFGILLMAISIIFTSIAQVQMADSWRIGIDQRHPTALKTKGFFAISRNPIFLGMLIGLLGMFLDSPTYFNLFILLISLILTNIQIRLEESFLKAIHGHQYQQYLEKTPRWLFI